MNFKRSKAKKRDDNHLIIRVTEYALEHDHFQLSEMFESLKLEQHDRQYVTDAMTNGIPNTDNPNKILSLSRTVITPEGQVYYYSLLPTGFYNYVDYLEIREARKASSVALWLSILAIIISSIIGIMQIAYQSNDTLRVDHSHRHRR